MELTRKSAQGPNEATKGKSVPDDTSLAFVKNFRKATKKKPDADINSPGSRDMGSNQPRDPLPLVLATNPLINLDKLPSMTSNSDENTSLGLNLPVISSQHNSHPAISDRGDGPASPQLTQPRRGIFAPNSIDAGHIKLPAIHGAALSALSSSSPSGRRNACGLTNPRIFSRSKRSTMTFLTVEPLKDALDPSLRRRYPGRYRKAPAAG